MDPKHRVVVSLPLDELWTADGPIEASRIRWLDHESLRRLVREGLLTLVIADGGMPLIWRTGRKAVVACWNDVKENVADPGPVRLDDYPGSYCFMASEWRTTDDDVIVTLERHH